MPDPENTQLPSDQPPHVARGMSKGLTSYGDKGFSLFLRTAFIKGAGYTDQALARPVIGIANTASAYNPCHGADQFSFELRRIHLIIVKY